MKARMRPSYAVALISQSASLARLAANPGLLGSNAEAMVSLF
jgi:hypothetical protein